ncbi:MAG: S1C family serine protease [Treponema sp.]
MKYLICCCLVLCVACTSVTPSFPPPVDYTDGGSVVREIETVRALIEEKPLEALLRAKRLQLYAGSTETVSALYRSSEAAVYRLFETAADENRWEDALRLFRSLEALRSAPAGWSEEKITEAQRTVWKEKGYTALLQPDTSHNSSAADEAPSIQTVGRMMKGTVTVWVDRGITIEKGMGRVDRMIGSGFFIDSQGYLITNYHVIQSDVDPEYEGYSRVYIKLPEDPAVRIPAKVVGWDPVFDLALLKTEITPEVYFQLGSSRDLNAGSKIYAIGSPAGLEQTVTSGIVSAQNRRFLSLGSVLQIDAPVNHGSSGGPIIDERGLVQAIVFAGLERQESLNFAIPVELLKLILPRLYAGGAVRHAWTAAYGRTAKGGENPGVELIYALPGSSSAHIPAGTLITHINGRQVGSLEALQNELMRLDSGTVIRISGRAPLPSAGTQAAEKTPPVLPQQDWYLLLEDRPEAPAEQIYRRDSASRAMLPLYGLYLETAGRRKSFRIADVIQGSYADEAGFSAGDYLEIRTMELRKDESAVYTQIYTKRRKAAYLDTFMDIWAYLDSPSYF